jgi:hypothetical protein
MRVRSDRRGPPCLPWQPALPHNQDEKDHNVHVPFSGKPFRTLPGGLHDRSSSWRRDPGFPPPAADGGAPFGRRPDPADRGPGDLGGDVGPDPCAFRSTLVHASRGGRRVGGVVADLAALERERVARPRFVVHGVHGPAGGTPGADLFRSGAVTGVLGGVRPPGDHPSAEDRHFSRAGQPRDRPLDEPARLLAGSLGAGPTRPFPPSEGSHERPF